MFFLSQKVPGFVALLTFMLATLFALALFPEISLLGDVSDFQGRLVGMLTASAGKPYFLITTSLLCMIPVLMKLPRKRLLKIWIQFGILLVLSFVAKTGLKQVTAVPRPYTHELQRQELIDRPEVFYELNQQQKDAVVIQASEAVSQWRTQHWLGETNYSFPSGHMIFAAVCVLFWGGFLFRQRKYWAMLPLLLWGVGVGLSRIWLGMHWPTDLLMSVVSAGALYLFVPEWQERKMVTGINLQVTPL